MSTHSFTYMSDEGISAVLTANRFNDHYPMSLTREDMAGLMYALRLAWERGDDNAPVGEWTASQVAEWAGSFASSIAETLGIDWV